MLFNSLLKSVDRILRAVPVLKDEVFQANGRHLSVAVKCPDPFSKNITTDISKAGLADVLSVSVDQNEETFSENRSWLASVHVPLMGNSPSALSSLGGQCPEAVQFSVFEDDTLFVSKLSPSIPGQRKVNFSLAGLVVGVSIGNAEQTSLGDEQVVINFSIASQVNNQLVLIQCVPVSDLSQS